MERVPKTELEGVCVLSYYGIPLARLTLESHLQIGQIFEGKYELLSVLGRGGLGVVYKARQIDFNRVVALKLIRSIRALDEDFRQRFLREAKILSELKNLNVVSIYGVGIAADQTPYMAMELVEGKNLRSLMQEDGAFAPSRALRVIRDAALALEYVHSHGIVHRDLKTENIILTNNPTEDTVKIIDFGLAKIDDEAKSAALTSTGELMGTPEFMSPEQCMGRKASKESDIYSLTVCLFELLTGKTPFTADIGIGVVYKHLNEPVPVLSRETVELYHPELNRIIQKGMAKSPADRFSDMGEMAEEINVVLAKLSNSSEAVTPRKKNKATKIGKTSIFVIGLVVISLLVLVWFSLPRAESVRQILAHGPEQASLLLENKQEVLLKDGKKKEALELFEEIENSKIFTSWGSKDQYAFDLESIKIWNALAPESATDAATVVLRKQISLLKKQLPKHKISKGAMEELLSIARIINSLPVSPSQWGKINAVLKQRIAMEDGHNVEVYLNSLAHYQKGIEGNSLLLLVNSYLLKPHVNDDDLSMGQLNLGDYALTLIDEKQFDEASKVASNAVMKYDLRPRAAVSIHTVLAVCAAQRANDKLASEEFAKAAQQLQLIEVNASTAGGYYENYGDFLAKIGELTKAARAYEKLLLFAERPELQVKGFRKLAAVYSKAGKAKDAQAAMAGANALQDQINKGKSEDWISNQD